MVRYNKPSMVLKKIIPFHTNESIHALSMFNEMMFRWPLFFSWHFSKLTSNLGHRWKSHRTFWSQLVCLKTIGSKIFLVLNMWCYPFRLFCLYTQTFFETTTGFCSDMSNSLQNNRRHTIPSRVWTFIHQDGTHPTLVTGKILLSQPEVVTFSSRPPSP